jgi:hypothetical protein
VAGGAATAAEIVDDLGFDASQHKDRLQELVSELRETLENEAEDLRERLIALDHATADTLATLLRDILTAASGYVGDASDAVAGWMNGPFAAQVGEYIDLTAVRAQLRVLAQAETLLTDADDSVLASINGLLEGWRSEDADPAFGRVKSLFETVGRDTNRLMSMQGDWVPDESVLAGSISLRARLERAKSALEDTAAIKNGWDFLNEYRFLVFDVTPPSASVETALTELTNFAKATVRRAEGAVLTEADRIVKSVLGSDIVPEGLAKLGSDGQTDRTLAGFYETVIGSFRDELHVTLSGNDLTDPIADAILVDPEGRRNALDGYTPFGTGSQSAANLSPGNDQLRGDIVWLQKVRDDQPISDTEQREFLLRFIEEWRDGQATPPDHRQPGGGAGRQHPLRRFLVSDRFQRHPRPGGGIPAEPHSA